jgi:hypothetical protein
MSAPAPCASAAWYWPSPHSAALVTGLFIAASLTDWLDGYLARKLVGAALPTRSGTHTGERTVNTHAQPHHRSHTSDSCRCPSPRRTPSRPLAPSWTPWPTSLWWRPCSSCCARARWRPGRSRATTGSCPSAAWVRAGRAAREAQRRHSCQAVLPAMRSGRALECGISVVSGWARAQVPT